jgi:hypothetical protein
VFLACTIAFEVLFFLRFLFDFYRTVVCLGIKNDEATKMENLEVVAYSKVDIVLKKSVKITRQSSLILHNSANH